MNAARVIHLVADDVSVHLPGVNPPRSRL